MDRTFNLCASVCRTRDSTSRPHTCEHLADSSGVCVCRRGLESSLWSSLLVCRNSCLRRPYEPPQLCLIDLTRFIAVES